MVADATGSPRVNRLWTSPDSPESLPGRQGDDAERSEPGEACVERRRSIHVLEGLQDGHGTAALGNDDLFPLPGPSQVVGQPVLQLPNAHRAHGRTSSVVAIVATMVSRVSPTPSRGLDRALGFTPAHPSQAGGRRLRRRGPTGPGNDARTCRAMAVLCHASNDALSNGEEPHGGIISGWHQAIMALSVRR